MFSESLGLNHNGLMVFHFCKLNSFNYQLLNFITILYEMNTVPITLNRGRCRSSLFIVKLNENIEHENE